MHFNNNLQLDKDYLDVYIGSDFIFSFNFSKRVSETKQREIADKMIEVYNNCINEEERNYDDPPLPPESRILPPGP